MKTRFLALLLTVAMMLGLCSCVLTDLRELYDRMPGSPPASTPGSSGGYASAPNAPAAAPAVDSGSSAPAEAPAQPSGEPYVETDSRTYDYPNYIFYFDLLDYIMDGQTMDDGTYLSYFYFPYDSDTADMLINAYYDLAYYDFGLDAYCGSSDIGEGRSAMICFPDGAEVVLDVMIYGSGGILRVEVYNPNLSINPIDVDPCYLVQYRLPIGGTGIGSTDVAVPPAYDGPVLPDPGDFFRCARDEDQSCFKDQGWLVSYDFNLDGDGDSAVYEFVDLLEYGGYDLVRSDYREADFTRYSALDCRTWEFSYVGSSSAIVPIEEDGYTFAVRILANRYYDRGSIGITVYFANGFELVNSGRTSTVELTDYSGKSYSSSATEPSGSTPYIPDASKLTCVICKGSGDCTYCDGRGYLWSSASKKYDRLCGRCFGSGDCTYCHGSGKRFE